MRKCVASLNRVVPRVCCAQLCCCGSTVADSVWTQKTQATITSLTFRSHSFFHPVLSPIITHQVFARIPKQAAAKSAAASKKGGGGGRKGKRGKGRAKGKSSGSSSGLTGVHKQVAQLVKELESRSTRLAKHVRNVANNVLQTELGVSGFVVHNACVVCLLACLVASGT